MELDQDVVVEVALANSYDFVQGLASVVLLRRAFLKHHGF